LLLRAIRGPSHEESENLMLEWLRLSGNEQRLPINGIVAATAEP
jgi:hypothetical protein